MVLIERLTILADFIDAFLAPICVRRALNQPSSVDIKVIKQCKAIMLETFREEKVLKNKPTGSL